MASVLRKPSANFPAGGVAFPNTHDNYYGSWSGWAYSNVVNTTTDGWGNQYAAVTGGGIRGGTINQRRYADPRRDLRRGLRCDRRRTVPPTITLPSPTKVLSADITNTTYAYLSMLDGNDYPAKQFGISDWFLLTISASTPTVSRRERL